MTDEEYDALIQDEVYRLAMLGWSARAIQRATTLSDVVVRRIYASAAKNPDISPACPCGRPRSHPKSCHDAPGTGAPPSIEVRAEVSEAIASHKPWRRGGGYTPELIDEVRSLIRGGMTHTAACRQLDISGTSILDATAAVRAEMADAKRYMPATEQRVPTKIDPAIVPRIEMLASQGVSAKGIRRALGISETTAARYAKPIWARMAAAGDLCDCGKPYGHTGTCSNTHPAGIKPAKAQEIRRLLLEGISWREIGRRIGVTPTGVRKFAERYQLRLGIAGERCACGRPRGHMYGCSIFAYRVVDDPAEVDRCIALLEQGRTLRQLVDEDGVREKLARITRAKLTEASKQKRRQALSARVSARIKKLLTLPPSISSSLLAVRRDALFARCSAAIPRSIERDIRDDAVTELYLAVLEGEVAEDEIGKVASKFINVTYSTWASRFGPRSLDAKLSADDDRTAGDFIEDEVALAQFDEIMIGGEDW